MVMALAGPAAAQVIREPFDLADGAPTFLCGDRVIEVVSGTGDFRFNEAGRSGRAVGGFVGAGTAMDDEGNTYRLRVNARFAESRSGASERFNATFVGPRGTVYTWMYQAEYGEEGVTESERGCQAVWEEPEFSQA
jgi:hypothetical protein